VKVVVCVAMRAFLSEVFFRLKWNVQQDDKRKTKVEVIVD